MFGEVLFCLVGKISLHFIKAQRKKKKRMITKVTDRQTNGQTERQTQLTGQDTRYDYFEGNPLVTKTSIEFEETHTVTETECLK